ncbi:MAG: menaquinone biosynthetic enzyme MqnA/MqnD family protein [Candidatus Methylomirabilales bacterium]
MRRPRVGKVRYINCEPVYYGIEEGAVEADCDMVEGTPAELNRMLERGDLDISVISSVAYAQAPGKYRLFQDLAIACDGAVGSVLFLSRLPLADLHGEKVLVTQESLTSVYLLRILLARGHGVHPLYLRGEVRGELPEEVAACLLIGDPALQAGHERRYPHQLDLGQGWKELTGLPFVFAFWGVGEEFYQAHLEETRDLHRALLASKAYSLARAEAISAAVHERVGISEEACLNYFRKQLSFDLTPRHLDGFERFLQMPEMKGLVPPPIPWRFVERT